MAKVAMRFGAIPHLKKLNSKIRYKNQFLKCILKTHLPIVTDRLISQRCRLMPEDILMM
jgi:hypothetical protein